MLSAVRPPAGVTLIELVIGLAVFALLLGLAAPAYQKWTLNTQVRTAADGTLNGLQLARTEALRRNRQVRFQLMDTLDGGCAPRDRGPSWVVSLKPAAGACQVEPSETVDPLIVQKHSGNEGSRNATLTALDAAGAAANTLTFDALGRVVNVNDIARIDIAAAGGDRSLSVRIAPGGEIRLCDPGFPSSHPQGC